jgi:predicted AlkP superfamily phosphohydrolase/phosphomutase
MTQPVIAIGLDAGDPALIEAWIDAGYLPTLKAMRDRGAYGRLKTYEYYRAETPWTTFLTGKSPQNTGYWAPLKMRPGTYQVDNVEAYDFAEHEPFYALGEDYRVGVFDMPQAPLSDHVNGLQVLAWGAHSPQTPSHSQPSDQWQAIVDRYGPHPTLRCDHASIMDVSALQELQAKMAVGIERRGHICRDLLREHEWDFFLTIFGETHTAGHFFWHLSQPDHPLYPLLGAECPGDPMQETFTAIDRAIADILSGAPENARIVVFAAHGMGTNVMDLPSMFFLPELLYRWNFPGKYGLAKGEPSAPVPPPIADLRAKKGWLGKVWSLKHEDSTLKGKVRQLVPTKIFEKIDGLLGSSSNDDDMISPFEMMRQGDPMFFQSACWYQPAWPKMKAFALPSFSEGYVRINLKGREPEGIVEPADYDALCSEIIEQIKTMKDARTGEPMVLDVIRTRTNPLDRDPKLPDADLVVIWQEKYATDVVDSPTVGRMGPLPYNRTGSHRSDGFLLVTGPGIAAGAELPFGHSLDLAPTLLSLMDAPIPSDFEGKPLVSPSVLVS